MKIDRRHQNVQCRPNVFNPNSARMSCPIRPAIYSAPNSGLSDSYPISMAYPTTLGDADISHRYELLYTTVN